MANARSRMMAWRLAIAGCAAAVAWQAASPPVLFAQERPNRVLVDAIHANEYSDKGLRPGCYAYHEIYGFRRGFEYLAARGIGVEYAKEGRLDRTRLAGCRLLFINLVSAERPPFLVSEIAAIREFVAAGGSLFVVTDHSNAYYHAWRLQPLFEELGLATFTDTACEEQSRLGNGNGWILIRKFTEHPLAAGLDCLAFQTGGCVDPRYAVAWTSDRSWADAWSVTPYGEGCQPGFYGNFTRDRGERSGPLGVVLAKTLGRGRIVVVGDQNFLGDPFINYADNYRLWLNAMAWLLHHESLRDAHPYQQWKSPRILLYEPYDRGVWGDTASGGCHHAQVLLSRTEWTFASNRLGEAWDLIVFADDAPRLFRDDAATVATHLRDGKNVLVLNAEPEILNDELSVTGQILRALDAAPRLSVQGALHTLTVRGGGRILVQASSSRIDNTTIGSPTQPPTPEELRHERALLTLVRGALRTGK